MLSLTYLLEANLSLLLFIGLYRLCFERLTFFEWNRFYLLSGLIVSLFIPLIGVPAFDWTPSDSPAMGRLAAQVVTIAEHAPSPGTGPNTLSLTTIASVLYGLVVLYHCAKLVIDCWSVLRLARRSPKQQWGSIRIIRVPDTMPVSSFFRYIFVPTNQLPGEAIAIAIRHEQVHSQQLLTFDGLLIRFIIALFWFNPLLRFWKKAIAMNHEYIADSQTVKTYDSSQYARLLVSLAAQPGIISTLHYFSYGQLKSRIIMLHQLRSKAIHRMRFLFVVPLVGLMLLFVSCEKSTHSELVNPNSLPKGAFLFNGLVGTWTNINRTTINADDGKSPRDFPKRAGEVRACPAILVLKADGTFQMSDERTGPSWYGTWQSDQFGISVQFHYFEQELSDNYPTVLYNRDGTVVKGPFPKTISLDVTSLKGGKMQAWQSYAISDHLSGGTIYYEYQKE